MFHRLAIPVLAMATACACVQASSAAEPPTVEQWQSDLDTLLKELPARHIEPFFHLPKQDFEHHAADLRIRLPTLAPHEIVIGFQSLVAALGDSHTSIVPGKQAETWHMYPVVATKLSDGFLVYATTPAFADLQGTTLLSLNGMPIADAAVRVQQVYPWENEAWRDQALAQYLTLPEVLHAVGVTAELGDIQAVVRTAGGTDKTVTLPMLPTASRNSLAAMKRPGVGPAAVSSQPHKESYWFADIPDTHALYVRYDRCSDDPGDPVSEFAKRLKARLDQDNVERLILDLRRNAGGDSRLLRPIVKDLKSRSAFNTGDGSLIVLIGRATFSSGEMNAVELRKEAKAVLIGGPTGQKPNAHGEVRTFTMPNSGMTLTYSTKVFNTDPADPPSTMPDVRVETTADLYRCGVDSSLEAALNYTKKPR